MGIWQLLAIAVIALVVASAIYLAIAQDWLADDVRRALRRRTTYLVGVPTLALMFLVAVPYVYLQAVTDDAPPPLTFADIPGMAVTPSTGGPASDSTAAKSAPVAPDPAATGPVTDEAAATSTTVGPTTTAAPAASAIEGDWVVGSGSQARYGIDDVILGQKERVVGSTDKVTGTMRASGTTITATSVVVDMKSVRCGCNHDAKYQDLLDTDQYPTSTFTLTKPIELGPTLPAEGQVVDVPATGTFTIHGKTRTVSFTLQALRSGGRIAVNGTIPVKLEDYDIERPDAGAFGSIDNAAIELLIAFTRA